MGVSCIYTLKLFEKINFTRPSEFLGARHLPDEKLACTELREYVARYCSRGDDLLAAEG